MKRFLIFFTVIVLFVSGCSINNTPTSKVEELFSKYQMLDGVDIDYEIVDGFDLSNKQKREYDELIKKQYKGLVYEVKDEKTDGDICVVTVEIKVLDYKRVLDNNYQDVDIIIDKLNDINDKVTYTIDVEVIKEDNEWRVNDLTYEAKRKIIGIF